ncbi:MAG: FHA domain-containing protein [Lachnospiraceae bacterium]|nr:FHA domain-containing protein [Lachnospiraceae bacterium]
MKTEYIRILNCNYERLQLEHAVEERRYQYCILGRGGIRYLLPCSLRILDEEYYLYYDISSKQNVSQIFEGKKIAREWMKHFLCEVMAMKAELERYLLEDACIVWNPGHIYQDLERDDFFFMYVPYDQTQQSWSELADFFLANLDYSDDELVEFTYLACDHLQNQGLEYLGEGMYKDFLRITEAVKEMASAVVEEEQPVERRLLWERPALREKEKEREVPGEGHRRFFFFWDNRKKKREEQMLFRQDLLEQMNGYAVCEETKYGNKEEPQEVAVEEEYGKTIFIEEKAPEKDRGLYQESGELLVKLTQFPFVIGKKRDSVNLVLNDYSISRVHARIVEIGGEHYLEDLNSTNGTYKNGLRLQPYEKRKLEEHDEVRLGKLEYTYR